MTDTGPASAQAEVVIDAAYELITDLPTLASLAEENEAVTSLMAETNSFAGLTQPQIVLCGASPDAARRTRP